MTHAGLRRPINSNDDRRIRGPMVRSVVRSVVRSMVRSTVDQLAARMPMVPTLTLQRSALVLIPDSSDRCRRRRRQTDFLSLAQQIGAGRDNQLPKADSIGFGQLKHHPVVAQSIADDLSLNRMHGQ